MKSWNHHSFVKEKQEHFMKFIDLLMKEEHFLTYVNEQYELYNEWNLNINERCGWIWNWKVFRKSCICNFSAIALCSDMCENRQGN